MIVKKALLETEKENIIKFLNQMDMIWDEDIIQSFYIEHNNEVIATGSRSNKVIKGLAVKKEWQSYNLISLIIDEIAKSFQEDNIYQYYAVTHLDNKLIFESLGFKEIIKNDAIIFMEKGLSSVTETLNNLKSKLEKDLQVELTKLNIGSVVINANPVTNGHVELIKYASKKHDLLLVFLVEENKSFFTYKERMSLLYLATHMISNVKILPSTDYLVSSATFPNYFLKNDVSLHEYQALIDTLVFKKYFIPIFNINKRYLGSEVKPYMVSYNNALVKAMGNIIEIVERFSINGVMISSSHVRENIQNNEVDEALKYIPKEAQTLFKNIVRSKIDGKDDIRQG